MHWCTSTRHAWKIPEYWKTLSDLFTVITLKTFGSFQVVNLKIFFFLFEAVRNFWGYQVFDFGPYTEMENSKN